MKAQMMKCDVKSVCQDINFNKELLVRNNGMCIYSNLTFSVLHDCLLSYKILHITTDKAYSYNKIYKHFFFSTLF